VLRQDPDDAESLFDLGRALVLEQRHTEAIAPLRRARDRRPDHLNTVAALGAALVEGTPQEAEEGCALLREALTKAEDHPGLWSSLGRYMHTIGDLEEAEACYRQAIERGLEPVQSLVHLVGMLRPEPEAEEVRDLRAAIAQTSGVLPRSAGHFALGAVYDRAGRYEEAWAEYAEGNRLRRGALEYDPKLEPAVTDALAGAFDEELLRERFGMGADSERPVFIFGMPRSGTTLTEQILVSHPQVAAGGELPTMGELRFTLPQRLGVPAASQEPLRKLDAAALQGVAEDYLQVLAAIDEDAPRVTDKMPANFRNLGLMALAFPQARFIHVQRDPVDTCLSCFFQNFNSGQEWSFNLAEAANYYLAYHRLMAHWREVLPVAMYEVRYEDLVADTEASVRGLLEYCGLPWDEQCLSFHETRRSVRTASINQVRRPIYKSSAGRWHHYEQHLQPLLEPLGALAEA
jgi:tetratricopeptide (TPR) repeat protein